MSERKYWNMEMEPLLNTPELKTLQLAKIRKQLSYVIKHSPYYREVFAAAKVKPEQMNSLEEFRRRVPLFDKKKQEASQMNSLLEEGHGLGRHLAQPLNRIALITATSGTTGHPAFYSYTARDLKLVYESIGRALWRMGLRPGERVMHAVALGMFAAGVPGVQALENFGACAVPAGINFGTEKIFLLTKLTGATTIISTPSYLEHMIEKAPQIIGAGVDSLGYKRLICGGEPGAGVPEVKRHLESAFNALSFDIIGAVWGATGCSCLHPEYQGMHDLTADLAYMELVHPETLEPLPLEDGEIGVSVLTALEWQAGPPIRYLIGDLLQISTTPCPCGYSGVRYRILGRQDDMLKVKGVVVYPSGIRDVLMSFEPEIAREFRIILLTSPPRVIPPLRLKVERGPQTPPEHEADLAQRIKNKMHRVLQITPEIEFVPYLTLPRGDHKTNYFERRYT